VFGNLITNRQLRTLMKENAILIDPFVEGNLKRTHYTLNPGRVSRRNEDGEWDSGFKFSDKRQTFELKANEYVIVEVKQNVKIISEGIVGRFISVSTNISKGLLLVAGQIDSRYGADGEALQFGVKNMLSCPNIIEREMRLAHVEFFDLRGITQDSVRLSAEEKAVWESRRRGPTWERDNDDGVRY
jgi:deoxycytidine triphosphate deaminase